MSLVHIGEEVICRLLDVGILPAEEQREEEDLAWREKEEKEDEEDVEEDEEEELAVYFKSKSSVGNTEFLHIFFVLAIFSPLHHNHDICHSATAPMAHVLIESCPNTQGASSTHA
jgi:hypothetical protein